MTNLTTEAEILAKIAALKEEIYFLENDANRLACMEQAVKIVLNGGYGALGSAAFRWYDETIAEGITATGQVAIRYITKKINEFVNERSGTVGVDYVVSSDTDSVTGDTILNTSIGKISIKDLYDKYTSKENELKQDGKDSVRTLNGSITSSSFDGKNIVNNNINYIMKHKVKKRMFRIKSGDSFVDVTEDHSVMVIRDNAMVSVKPKEILKSDKIIKI